jgi:hypothetical protein
MRLCRSGTYARPSIDPQPSVGGLGFRVVSRQHTVERRPREMVERA